MLLDRPVSISCGHLFFNAIECIPQPRTLTSKVLRGVTVLTRAARKHFGLRSSRSLARLVFRLTTRVANKRDLGRHDLRSKTRAVGLFSSDPALGKKKFVVTDISIVTIERGESVGGFFEHLLRHC